MATIVKSPAGTWKAVIRKAGWPTASKTFRTKRDAEDWARRTEDQMVRGVYIQRAPAERMSVETALKRYLKEVTPTKRQSTQIGERKKAQALIQHLGKYSLAALSADVVAQYRDTRLAGDKNERGKVIPAATTRYAWSWPCSATCSLSRSRNGALVYRLTQFPIFDGPLQARAAIGD